MRAHSIVALIVLVALVLPAASANPLAGDTKTYVGSSSQLPLVVHTAYCGFTSFMGPPAGIGGVCFDVPSYADHVSFTINDAATPRPGGWVYFLDDNQNTLIPKVHFCTPSFSRDLPSGTTRIVVQMWDPAYHHDDPLCSATAGTVTANFR